MGSTNKRPAVTPASAYLSNLRPRKFFGKITDLAELDANKFLDSLPGFRRLNWDDGRKHSQIQDDTTNQPPQNVQEASPRASPSKLPVTRRSNARKVRTPPLKGPPSDGFMDPNPLLGKPYLSKFSGNATVERHYIRLALTYHVLVELYYGILNQPTTWSSDGIDLLSLFDTFKANQAADEEVFNLSRDDICDLTPDGEFFRSLSLRQRNVMNQDKPNLPITDQLKDITDELFELSEGCDPTFGEVLDRVRSMDHEDDLVQYVSFVLTSMEPHFCYEKKINEHQYLSEFILPALSRSFLKHGLRMETFEVTLLSSSEKNNQGRNAMNEADTQPHRADAVVNADGCQVMIVESSRLAASKEEKQSNHDTLSRDMRDTQDEFPRDGFSRVLQIVRDFRVLSPCIWATPQGPTTKISQDMFGIRVTCEQRGRPPTFI
ncbi:hypothetical protein BGX34_007590 [Mortierella sp. NVP85]|nr:hypothetical protein BGX34_007579 [Mortierella sp. NVP85]KAF9365923.1 hypothetical protein BGX34_007590 [Mortierella sp. NVP85]